MGRINELGQECRVEGQALWMKYIRKKSAQDDFVRTTLQRTFRFYASDGRPPELNAEIHEVKHPCPFQKREELCRGGKHRAETQKGHGHGCNIAQAHAKNAEQGRTPAF